MPAAFNSRRLTQDMQNTGTAGDVKFREFFALKYFMKEILNISEIFQKFHDVLCIVHCNKVSKPVKGNLLLCMNNIV